MRILLNRAIYAIATDYRGAELYDYLCQTLGMKDDEISKAGFNLKEFYAEPDEYIGNYICEDMEDENDAEL